MAYVHGKSIIKIAVADDHVMLRETLCAAIDTWEYCKVVMQASDGKELVDRIQQHPSVDLVLLDIDMPVMNGFDALIWLKKKYPAIRVLVISFYSTDLTLTSLLKAGVNGYLPKSETGKELKKAVFELMKTGNYFGSESTRITKPKLNNGEAMGQAAHLSDKERLFVKHLCSDMTYKEIASKLKITERQADYMRAALFERFEVQSRVGLAMYMSKSGVV